ncbi:Rne/Rng family ribonuclease [Yimella sp. cx-51]|uniref:Rne/Rng family ribonuclease n=1 Tax=Yimella sp. cx-51 TaxID=2770551 RepID=UPI00165E4537|nr:Rne/Rng family ribonuclease [Yimella sp. cx-51]MBC9956859.1 Rne/Rng family ribonuclease [Yimella sp. cx-51]QTH39085.1 Rne/Rng family ribonuclease [Yimella sp. cx-51]
MGPQHDEPGNLFSEPVIEQQPAAQDGADAASPAPALQAPMSFGLLFQTPDLQVRAPRRSSVEEQRAQLDDNTDDASQESDDSSDQGDDNDEQSSGNRSRRRGGRGRRTRNDNADSSDSSGNSDNSGKAGDSGADRQTADGGKTETGDADDASKSGESDRSGDDDSDDDGDSGDAGSRRRTRRRRRSGSGPDSDDPPGTVTKVREPRPQRDEVTAIKGSTRLEAKKQRRREGREAGRRRTSITEAEFLARRESVDRVMVVRERDGRTQIGVLEDGILVEHYVSRETQQASMAGNVYLGRVQNVLPSMEAAFVDIGRGRNAVLYAGEVNWDAAGLDNQPKRIEHALSSGESVLVQVTKDPIGHKGARLTSQISLPGRFLVYVPGNAMTGISRKLPDNERARLKKILKEIVPADAGVIVRTAAEGASEEDLKADIERLQKTWEQIQKKSKTASAPSLLHGEPDLTLRVIRDVFNEDFSKLVVAGDKAWDDVSGYIGSIAPDLEPRLEKWTGETDLFTVHRVDEQLAKALDRKVWLPSGGSLVIDRTEAMTVIDVNTGKFVGSGGNLEETVTRNNLEAAEEIVRQLRLRDIGGIVVVDFIDMVLESNRDLVVRRLLECLGRDRTKHQVAEVTSLGLVQMTRKRVGSGLLEIFSEPCVHCDGRGVIVHGAPVEKSGGNNGGGSSQQSNSGNSSGQNGGSGNRKSRRGRRGDDAAEQQHQPSGPTAAQIAAAAHAAANKKAEAAAESESDEESAAGADVSADQAPAAVTESVVADAPEQKSHQPASTKAEPPAEVTVEPEVVAPAIPVVEPPAPRRRGSRRAGSPSVAPTSAPEPVEVPKTVVAGEVKAAEAADSTAASASPSPQGPAAAAPTRRRPRRARVVSPAGPPANLDEPTPDR